MYLKNKIFKAVCPIIAVFFFFATITPAVARAQANEKRVSENSFTMLKLALAAKNGPSLLGETRQAVKEKILLQVENFFNKISQSGFSDKKIQKFSYILPRNFAENIQLVSAIAKADIPTEEKVAALVEAFDYSCDEIIWIAAVVQILDQYNVISTGPLANLLYALAALCYYGLI